MNALLLSMVGGLGALFSSVYAPETVYLVLVSISGLAVVVVWMAIALSQFNFRRHYLREGGQLKDLVYRTPFSPWVPIIAFAACLAACIGIAFDPHQRVALYFGVPILVYPNSGEVYDAVTKTWHPAQCDHTAADISGLAQGVEHWLAAGASGIGGCCRTTPEDIHSLSEWRRSR